GSGHDAVASTGSADTTTGGTGVAAAPTGAPSATPGGTTAPAGGTGNGSSPSPTARGPSAAASGPAATGQRRDALGRPLEGDKGKCARGALLQETVTRHAPPCMPAFVGDNGGATYQGVTADEITIVIAFS